MSMDIYANPGTKVIFTGNGGYAYDNECARSLIKVGQELTVKRINVDNWISHVEFEEIPGKFFNTVMFDEVEQEPKNEFWESQEDFTKAMQEGAELFDKQSDEFWNGLTYEQKLNAFHSVCKRIYQGDVKEGRSYRGVLYNIFGFGPDSYLVGMECNYIDLHNYIQDGVASYKNYKEK